MTCVASADVSSGRELRACQLDGLRISEVEVAPGLRLGPHAHRAAQICFVLEGRYRERWPEREQELAPGDAFFRPAGLPHANRFAGDGALTIVVSVDASRLPGGSPRLPGRLDRPAVRWLRDEVRRELRCQDPCSAWALEGLALLLMAELGRRSGPGSPDDGAAGAPDWVREAVGLIEAELDGPLGLTGLAARVGVHRATLAAGFRRHLGTSVGERLREARLRHAARLLATTRLPLAEVALSCGFADQSHLGRAFRRATGDTPGRYRERRARRPPR